MSAIARPELVRTLRRLDAVLDEIGNRWIGWLTGIFATPDSPGLPDTPECRTQSADSTLAGVEWDRTPPEPEGRSTGRWR